MTSFTPLASLIGGALIGIAAVLLMALHGRIAGVTGILGGLLPPVLAPENRGGNDWLCSHCVEISPRWRR